MRDGGLMHILRHYRPDAVYLFLTREIVRLDSKDQRIDKTFAFIRENWGGYAPQVVRFETDIDDPSDMDVLTEPMTTLLEQILQEHPKAQILMNLSSGTPQMQIILAQMALDSRYSSRGIQVKTPERQSGTAERTNTRFYPVDEALGLNEDEEPGAPNRCCEPKMIAVRREAVRNQLNSLLDHRNYDAIAQMGADLPAPIPQLARHLDYRSRFLLQEAQQITAGLGGLGLPMNRDPYPYPIYEMIEYFAMLKNLVYLKRYTDFILRVNPFLVRLQLALLRHSLAPHGLTDMDLVPLVDKHRKLSPQAIWSNFPAMATALETAFNKTLEERDASIAALNVMLGHLGVDASVLSLLSDCQLVNKHLRNPAAHDLFSATNDQIRNLCGRDAEGIVRGLEQILTDVLEPYQDRNLKKRINIYGLSDRIIRDCL
jgi:hypothetical protein